VQAVRPRVRTQGARVGRCRVVSGVAHTVEAGTGVAALDHDDDITTGGADRGWVSLADAKQYVQEEHDATLRGE